MPKIYCIEDDESIRELIVYALNTSGFEGYGFEDSVDFYRELDKSLPDLILLDIMLPGDDGLTILDNLRKNSNTKDIPVIMLTAKSSEYDKVKGLDMGADDYMSKPFGVMELISRINAVLRRSGQFNSHNLLSLDNIVIDYDKRIVRVDNEVIKLTYKEFELLYYLIKNQNIVLTREMIMNEVWGFDFEGETRTVDVHIGTLRQKLGESGKLIQTIRNVGYKVGEIL
ncbi:MAG TPA: response regulator transcription factor [Tissierellaceae bacterium]|nr:response regulator transcription factor [Tissierellaceae bacterium]